MATETFTLTLNDTPSENVSVTINDTSQANFKLIGWTSGIGTYTDRSWDVYGDTLAVWRKSDSLITTYNIASDTETITPQGQIRAEDDATVGSGVDTQGWNQLMVGHNTITAARPFANSNAGVITGFEYNHSTNRFTGNEADVSAFQSVNFNFYKIACSKGVDGDWLTQIGFTGNYVQNRRNQDYPDVDGINFSTSSSASNNRFTRGIACASGSSATAYVYGKTPNGSNRVIMHVWFKNNSNNQSIGELQFNVQGRNGEVARYCRITNVKDNIWFLAMTGDNAGTQIYRIIAQSVPSATLVYNSNTIDNDGSIEIYTVYNTNGDPWVVMLLGGKIIWSEGSDGTTWSEFGNNYLSVNFAGSNAVRGLCRIGGTTGANPQTGNIVFASAGRLYVVDPSGFHSNLTSGNIN